MNVQGKLIATLTILAGMWLTTTAASAADLLDAAAIDQLAARKNWQISLPLQPSELVTRTVLLDDNLYALTNQNRAFAVHSRTGIIRWGRLVAKPGLSVRGPTHSKDYVFFTDPAAVKVIDRRTGDLIGEPRRLRGFIIEMAHDIATVSIGRAHGVRGDHVLNIVRLDADGVQVGEPLAKLKMTSVGERKSKGRVIRKSRTLRIEPGLSVAADVTLPLRYVQLPFAASGPAVADDKSLFVGAGNERLYSIRILTGFENWRVMTPKTLTTAPVLDDEHVYFAGQDGRVVCCTKIDRERKWVYRTEGPIFADLVVSKKYVYAASTDRLLYCLDRTAKVPEGRRVWRRRFDNAPAKAPVLHGGRLYQEIPNEGLFVLDAETGRILWQRPEGGAFLTQVGRDIYLFNGRGTGDVVRVDATGGKVKRSVACANVDFVDASQTDQLITFTTKLGRLMCVRPKSAPRLKPSDLAQVLRDDNKIKAAAALKAERAAGKAPVRVAAKPLPKFDYVDDDDWLESKSKVKPVGGDGLVDAEEAEEDAPAEDEEEAGESEEEEEGDDEEDEEEDDEEDEEDDDEEEDDDDDEEEDDDDEEEEDDDDEDWDEDEEDDEDEDDEDEEEED